MNLHPVASRYATALFQLARERDQLDVAAQDLSALRKLCCESDDFRDFVANPLLKPEKQKEALSTCMHGKINPLTLQFLQQLCDRERLAVLPDICHAFHQMVQEENGVLEVQVVSAQKLEAAQLDRLKEKLARKYGKSIELEETVDPELIGGFTLQVGDEITDYSVATQLAKFRRQVMR